MSIFALITKRGKNMPCGQFTFDSQECKKILTLQVAHKFTPENDLVI